MFKFLALAIALFFSLKLLASESGQPEKWTTVRSNEIASYDIDELSIKPISETAFIFVHRTRLAKPIPLENTKTLFDTMVFMSAADCKEVKSKILADVALLSGKPVAVNTVAESDEPSTPSEGSFHYMVMEKVCPIMIQNLKKDRNRNFI